MERKIVDSTERSKSKPKSSSRKMRVTPMPRHMPSSRATVAMMLVREYERDANSRTDGSWRTFEKAGLIRSSQPHPPE